MADQPVLQDAADGFRLIDLGHLLRTERLDGVNDLIVERDQLFNRELGGTSSGCSHKIFAYR